MGSPLSHGGHVFVCLTKEYSHKICTSKVTGIVTFCRQTYWQKYKHKPKTIGPNLINLKQQRTPEHYCAPMIELITFFTCEMEQHERLKQKVYKRMNGQTDINIYSLAKETAVQSTNLNEHIKHLICPLPFCSISTFSCVSLLTVSCLAVAEPFGSFSDKQLSGSTISTFLSFLHFETFSSSPNSGSINKDW